MSFTLVISDLSWFRSTTTGLYSSFAPPFVFKTIDSPALGAPGVGNGNVGVGATTPLLVRLTGATTLGPRATGESCSLQAYKEVRSLLGFRTAESKPTRRSA